MPLSKEIQAVSQARYDLAQSNHKSRMRERFKAGEFVETADAEECLWLITELIERVSSLTGCASELEDAACVLKRHIESEVE